MQQEARAVWAVRAIFFVYGILMGNLAAQFADIKEELGAADGPFGWALLGATIGALVGAKPAGFLSARLGARTVTRIMAIAMPLTVALLAYAGNLLELFFVFVGFGFAVAGINIGMNSLALEVERNCRRPIMASAHGSGSAGCLVGALAGGVAAHLASSTEATFTLLTLFCACSGLLATNARLFGAVTPASVEAGTAEARERSIGDRFSESWGTLRVSFPLAAVAFCFYIAEASVDDWSGIYLRDSLSAPALVTGWGYAAFQTGMLIGRFFVDKLVLRYGPVRVVRTGSLTAGAVLILGLALNNIAMVIAAFLLYGIGLSATSPISLRAAGNISESQRERILANVTAGGYIGLLVGPVIIGQVAQIAGISVAMGIPAVLAICVALMAPAVRAGGFKEAADFSDEKGKETVT